MKLIIENNIVKEIVIIDGETDVIIPDGVTEIGNGVFSRYYDMTSATIPDSVTRIGKRAFFCCERLTKLYLPDSVTDIGDNAFERCKDLITNRSIKQWDPKYGFSKMDYAFHYMRNYQAGDPFFDGVKSVNDKYIRSQRAKLIKKITVSDAAIVSYMTREGLLSADDIDLLFDNLSENVEIAAMLLDYKHKHFTEEYLEQREIDKFEKEVGIKERTLADWKKIYQLCENTEQGGYTLKKYKGTETEIVIPDHIDGKPVTRIGKQCFSPNGTTSYELSLVREKILSVFIPDTVICIEEGAFKECRSLTEITMLNSVVSIGDDAFKLCENLTKVTLSESLISIPKNLFSDCRSLDRIKIPSSVKNIGMNAFSYCGKLTEIDIPDNVKEIGVAAFSGCSALKRVSLPKGLKTISQFLFLMCDALTKIEIPESVTFIQNNAFSACSALTEITLPKGIKSIEFSTFGNCKSLNRVSLPKGLKRIENSAFFGCTGLHELTIPASVSFINPNSFNKTKDLIISAPRGSYAIEFAKTNGINFKEI